MRAFLVLKLQRTGSTMFGHVLDTHPSVMCTNEYLNRVQDQPRRVKVRALAEFYRDGSTDEAIGQTMNPFKYRLRPSDVARGLTGVPALLAGRRELPIAVVVLRRDDVLKQAVSAYRARRQGYESNRAALADDSILAPQRFDVDELREIVLRLTQTRARLLAFADRLRADRVDISYEDLLAEPRATYAVVFDHLGVAEAPAGFDHTGGFSKLHSDDLRSVIANYDDLVRDRELARYLDRR